MTLLGIAVLLLAVAVVLIFYLVWAMQQRLDKGLIQLQMLNDKLRDGEKVITDNFELLAKKCLRLENEIKTLQRGEPKIKEALKTAKLARRRDIEQQQ